ncbi:unnamed protein product [Effrenium voratum]|nr:unnamed protein product [Effrenium voratum]
MVDAAKRTDAKGARSLEETLAQFGLDAVVAQETTKETTVTMQSLMTDSGFEETALEAGFTGNDQAQEVLEMDLELRDEDRAMEPQEEKEDLPLNDCEEELHIS